MAEGAEDVPVIYLHEIKRAVQARRGDADHPQRRQARAVGGAIGGAGGAIGFGQIDAAAYRGPARDPRRRRGLCRGRADLAIVRHRPHPDPALRHRLRLSVAPAAAGIHRARKRHAAADDPRPQTRPRPSSARPKSWPISASATASRTGRPNCPAANSSASRSRARSPMRRGRCWRTSRPETSIRTPPITSSMR